MIPPNVDPCGENGEFHTFVHAGPIFNAPIEVELSEVAVRDGFVFRIYSRPTQAAGPAGQTPK